MCRLAVAGLLFLMAGCSDGEIPRGRAHWFQALDGYELTPREVWRSRSGGDRESLRFEVRHGSFSLDDRGVRLSLSQAGDPTSFWLELVNGTPDPLQIVWDDSRYVDEVGAAHPIYAQPMNPLPSPEIMERGAPPTDVIPGARINFVAAPPYKAMVVRYDAYERGPFHAPLIPTNLTDLERFPDQASVAQYVGDVVSRRIPVELVLVIRTGQESHEYHFSFVLERSRLTTR